MEFPLNPKSIGIPLAYQVTPYQDVWHQLRPEIWAPVFKPQAAGVKFGFHNPYCLEF